MECYGRRRYNLELKEAKHQPIYNRNSSERRNTMSRFNDLIDEICGVCGGSTTSGKRSVKHNDEVGGVENSLHLIGLAVDMIFDDQEGKELAHKLAERADLLVIDEGDHLHIQQKR